MRLQLSNDAFWLLYCEEEPIDEANITEAQAIAAKFPNGFTIADDWVELGDTGLIEATFLVDNIRPPEYTHKIDFIGGWELLFYIDGDTATYMWWHLTKEPESPETVPIEHIMGKQWITTKLKSKFPLFKAKRV